MEGVAVSVVFDALAAVKENLAEFVPTIGDLLAGDGGLIPQVRVGARSARMIRLRRAVRDVDRPGGHTLYCRARLPHKKAVL